MAGNVQKFGFFKNPLSESGSWSTWFWFKNVYFWSEFFFQMLLENFLCVVWSCSIYLEVCARPYVYARKKIRVIRHTYQKIQTKTRFKSEKNPVQNSFPSEHCSKWNSLFLKVFNIGKNDEYLPVDWYRVRSRVDFYVPVLRCMHM